MEYQDILYMQAPKSKNHPPMDRGNRAAQFAPFAALTGYHEAIDEEGRYVDRKIELALEAREDLDRRLSQIMALEETDQKLELIYFEPDPEKEGGFYKKTSGKVVGWTKRGLALEGGRVFDLGDILEIHHPIFEEVEYL